MNGKNIFQLKIASESLHHELGVTIGFKDGYVRKTKKTDWREQLCKFVARETQI